MKTRQEIQLAHDRLEPFVCEALGDCWNQLRAADQHAIHAALDVLCWILECPDKSEVFQRNLATIEEFLQSNGYHMDVENPLPFPMTKRPGSG